LSVTKAHHRICHKTFAAMQMWHSLQHFGLPCLMHVAYILLHTLSERDEIHF